MTKNGFQIEALWEKQPEASAVDLAKITIIVGARSVTRLVDSSTNETRDYVRASAVSLAIWFADNWWRLRWEPIETKSNVSWRLRHEITSASGGVTWPPLMIYGVGERVVVAPISTALEIGSGPVEFRAIPVSILPAKAYEAGVNNFFDNVLKSCEGARDWEPLNNLVQQLTSEWSDPDVSSWRRLEAKLGYDPDEAPEGLIEKFVDLEKALGSASIEEAALSSQGARSAAVLEKALDASRVSKVAVNLAAARSVADPKNDRDSTKPIWQVAENAAVRLRLASTGRLDGPFLNPDLSDVIHQKWSKIKNALATARHLPYATRMNDGAGAEKLAMQAISPEGRRFEIARIIGDAVWTNDDRFGVVSRAKTDRQKFQRAFAQSLLCPFEDLVQHIDLTNPTKDQIDAAARRYQVHPEVVRTVLVNKRLLPRETLDQELEAA
ncbi:MULTISPECIES: hypothetical protein [unclassified Bradyrhizobium]|uniref:hypothetical protein n=1 Tax=unclassified Bradyrhizobium TaxID=2631580 RepID=UPI0028E7DDD9|nr:MULTISPECIES: hypothetical protein [unclassified Bradyrhizobium]